jgi:hypothetical protein
MDVCGCEGRRSACLGEECWKGGRGESGILKGKCE